MDPVQSMSQCRIEPVQKKDFDSIMNLEQNCFLQDEVMNQRELLRLFDSSHAVLFKTMDLKGRITGCIIGEYSNLFKNCYIVTLAVRSCSRQQGLGSALLQHLIEYSQESTTMTLHVDKQRKSALKMYTAFGFEVLEDSDVHYKMKLKL